MRITTISVALFMAGLVIQQTCLAQQDGWQLDGHAVVLTSYSDRVYLGVAKEGLFGAGHRDQPGRFTLHL